MYVHGLEIDDAILLAIRERRVLTFVYNKTGSTPETRSVDPHVVYRTSTGKYCLHGVQTAGPSEHGSPIPGWRPFELSHLEGVVVGTQHFSPDERLNLANSSFYARVYASVED